MSEEKPGHQIGKRIGEFLILAIYLFLDVHSVWPESHIIALLVIPPGVVALMLLDGGFRTRWLVIITAALILICGVIYFVAPPILPEETEHHGWLLPADKPTPPNGCDGERIPPNTMMFLLGHHAIVLPINAKPTVLLTVGGNYVVENGIPRADGSCTAVSVEISKEGLAFDVDVHDTTDELVARIRKNEFNLVPGKYAYRDRSHDPDRSEITVYDKKGNLLFSVRYLNARTVQLFGRFVCGDGTRLIVGESGSMDFTITGTRTQVWLRESCVDHGFWFSHNGFRL